MAMEIERTKTLFFKCKRCNTAAKLEHSLQKENENIKIRCPKCRTVYRYQTTAIVSLRKTNKRRYNGALIKYAVIKQFFLNRNLWMKDLLFFIIVISAYILFAVSLGQGNIQTFIQINLVRTVITLSHASMVSIFILGISTVIAYIHIHWKKNLNILSLILSMCPVVLMIELFQDSLDGICLQWLSLTFSGFLIYYFSGQLYLELENEIKKTYIESYRFKNKPLLLVLHEKIMLDNIRQFPVCCIQVATYTLFTDLLIYEEQNGIGIMSWLFTIEKQGTYPDKTYSIYCMIIIGFIFFLKLYNSFILKIAEHRLTGK